MSFCLCVRNAVSGQWSGLSLIVYSYLFVCTCAINTASSVLYIVNLATFVSIPVGTLQTWLLFPWNLWDLCNAHRLIKTIVSLLIKQKAAFEATFKHVHILRFLVNGEQLWLDGVHEAVPCL